MRRTVVRLVDFGVGILADDKNIARRVRDEEILPKLELECDVVIDFKGVENATQGFLHALIVGNFEQFGDVAYRHLCYRNATDGIKEMIAIIYQYCQE